MSDTRQRLLDEARDLYLQGGLAGFSLREVARRAGVSAAAVYRHYDGKEALLREVCGEGFRVFSSYLLKSLAAPTAKTRLHTAAEQYMRFALEEPHHYRFIFMGAAEDIGQLGPELPLDQHEPTFQFLIDRVRECMQAKVLARGDAALVATQIWAHVHGLVSLRLSGHLKRISSDAEFTKLYVKSCNQFFAALGE